MTETTVTEIKGHTDIDPDSGSLLMFRKFHVQRPGKDKHTVRVEISESGTPQAEKCDCHAYRYRGECPHIEAVYEAGVLCVDWEA